MKFPSLVSLSYLFLSPSHGSFLFFFLAAPHLCFSCTARASARAWPLCLPVLKRHRSLEAGEMTGGPGFTKPFQSTQMDQHKLSLSGKTFMTAFLQPPWIFPLLWAEQKRQGDSDQYPQEDCGPILLGNPFNLIAYHRGFREMRVFFLWL